MKNNTYKYFFITILLSLTTIAYASPQAENSLSIGGTSDLLFTSETTGYASASGTFSALVATITLFEPQSDGSIILGSSHNFKTSDNGYFNTVDISNLYPVQDKPGIYIITTTFNIKKSAGSLSGYDGGSFTGTGIINFTNNTANVRYEGSLLKNTYTEKKKGKSVFEYFDQ